MDLPSFPTSPQFHNLIARVQSGENVEAAFLETARKIYQNVQEGSVNLNSAEGGVLNKNAFQVGASAQSTMGTGGNASSIGGSDGCSC